MSRHIGSDLILSLIPGCIRRTAPTIRTLCPQKQFRQAGIVHSAHMSKPSKTIPLNPLPNGGLIHATVPYRVIP